MTSAAQIDRVTLDPPYKPVLSPWGEDATSAFSPHSTQSELPAGPRWVDRTPQSDADEERTTYPITLTNHLFSSAVMSPLAVFKNELKKRAEKARADLQAYRSRISALEAEAVQDGFELNEASEGDFLYFVQSEPFLRKAGLVLMDNGNLRAVWKDGEGSHIGLQFLGQGNVQYVIFKRRKAGGQVSRVSGRDSMEGVKRQISAFSLKSLIYG